MINNNILNINISYDKSYNIYDKMKYIIVATYSI